MLYLIGTGIYYLTDISVRGLDTIKLCDEIFLERYTNLNDVSELEEIEKRIKKKITVVDRVFVESDILIEKAKNENVALLVPGDPLAATTHISLIKSCKENGIAYTIIHSSSVFSAIYETGLSPYRFGATTSIPLFREGYRPESFFDTIENNLKINLHTLVLLEAVNENEYVSAEVAANILKEIEIKRSKKIIDWHKVIAISKLGGKDQSIGFLEEIKNRLNPPISIIITANMTKNEEDATVTLLKN